MIEVTIPGFGSLALQYLVADYNGTLALDGTLLPGVAEALRNLATRLDIHVVTADTFGTARAALAQLPVRVVVLASGPQDEGKRQYIEGLGADRCVAIGNGLNDRLLLEAAALGIAVVQREGAAARTLQSADLVTPDIDAALGLLMNSSRLIATLRR